ncbi:hypothetical protein OS175_11935 [Marinicella sp. S1101]|uniref:hypothetical protein n=1 Tax=Marinicella marina TaxID=2996016 RepID=UPI00226091CD|nr:hypothetical protein [Marinicella marina]MCX7554593.1 hypothetical protein [Marinicella marina]MDJ1141023.1 hypothetical protein [Marinicella marina]
MKKYLTIVLLIMTCHASAVFVNHKGFGEVLLIPYYTINNNLNTLVTVTNTTAQGKAIKIHLREGLNGYSVLSYNVYLGAHDTWSFVLGRYTSSADNPSVYHSAYDSSCSTGITSSEQEVTLSNVRTGPLGVSRTREGYIEILEMASIPEDTSFFAAADHGGVGVPADCALFEAAWDEGGVWSTNPQSGLEPPSGGLMAAADLIDVAEGINYSVPVMALSDFYAEDQTFHVEPSDHVFSLDSAKNEAVVIDGNDQYSLEFNSGIDAVSAVLMSDKVISTYVLDAIVAGKTDVVYTQPTRRFYWTATVDPFPYFLAPYNVNAIEVENCQTDDLPSSFYGGIEILTEIYDRESTEDVPAGGIAGPIPPQPNLSICGSVFVHSIIRPYPGQPTQVMAGITGSENFRTIYSVVEPQATENGYMSIEFLDSRPISGRDVNDEAHQVQGIPITGVTFFRFTNAGAGAGLLAQYGGAYPLKTKTTVN